MSAPSSNNRLEGFAATALALLGFCAVMTLDSVVDGALPLSLGLLLDVAGGAAFAGSLLLLPVGALAAFLVGPLARLIGRHKELAWRLTLWLAILAAGLLAWCVGVYEASPHYPVSTRNMNAYKAGIVALAPLSYLLAKALAPLGGSRWVRLLLASSLVMLVYLADSFMATYIIGKLIYWIHILAAMGLFAALFLLMIQWVWGSQRLVALCFGAGGLLFLLGGVFLLRWESSLEARDRATRGSDFMMASNELVRVLQSGDVLEVLQKRAPAAPPEEMQPFSSGEGRPLLQQIAETKPRNVLLLSVDSLRVDALRDPTLKVMPRLMREGVTLPDFRGTAPGTLESFSALFFGNHLGRPGLSFVEVLQANGFSTIGVSVTRNIVETSLLQRGFGVFDGKLVPRSYEAKTAGLVVDHLMSHLEAHKEEPFFAWAHFYEPHIPYDSPDGDSAARYRIEVARVDEELGRLMTFVEASGLASSTLIVLIGDHGEEFWEHGGQSHARTLYEEVLQVPMVLYAPGGAVRGEVHLEASNIDLGATLLGLLGVTPPKEFQPEGKSLLHAPAGRPLFAARGVFWRQFASKEPAAELCVRWGRYKLLVNLEYQSASLYDLSQDPAESNNLIEQEPAIAASLARELARLLAHQAHPK